MGKKKHKVRKTRKSAKKGVKKRVAKKPSKKTAKKGVRTNRFSRPWISEEEFFKLSTQ